MTGWVYQWVTNYQEEMPKARSVDRHGGKSCAERMMRLPGQARVNRRAARLKKRVSDSMHGIEGGDEEVQMLQNRTIGKQLCQSRLEYRSIKPRLMWIYIPQRILRSHHHNWRCMRTWIVRQMKVKKDRWSKDGIPLKAFLEGAAG